MEMRRASETEDRFEDGHPRQLLLAGEFGNELEDTLIAEEGRLVGIDAQELGRFLHDPLLFSDRRAGRFGFAFHETGLSVRPE